MTTFTTEDRELVELLVKTFQPQNNPQANARDKNTEASSSKTIAYYRIEDSSEDLDDWPS